MPLNPEKLQNYTDLGQRCRDYYSSRSPSDDLKSYLLPKKTPGLPFSQEEVKQINTTLRAAIKKGLNPDTIRQMSPEYIARYIDGFLEYHAALLTEIFRQSDS